LGIRQAVIDLIRLGDDGMPAKQIRAKRQPVNQEGMIYGLSGGQIAPCRLRNISATGAQIELLRETVLPKW
jgi:hypothetical protein